MFEKFKKLKIQGGCFDEETTLELFMKDAITVVYGRNGSGKTTIAHGIKQLAIAAETEVDETKANHDTEFTVSADVAISNDLRKQVFVFDEDFVNEHIRLRKNGIQTIVMIGEQVEIDRQIEAKQELLKEVERQIDELAFQRSQYDDTNNAKSPGFHYNKLYDALRADNGWAEIDREIRGNKVKSRVTDFLVELLLSMEEPAESYQELYDRFLHEKDVYLKSLNAEPITWEGIILDYPKTLDSLVELLQTPVDRPELSEREQRLLGFISTHPQQDISRMMDEKWEFCPLCLRNMTAHDHANLSATLTKLLNRQADEYKEKLDDARRQYWPVVVNLPKFSGNLYQDELQEVRRVLDELNVVTQRVRDTIGWRSIKVYEIMEKPFPEEFMARYEKAVQNTERVVAKLILRVGSFNKMVSERNKQREMLLMENKKLARKQLASSLEMYRQAKDDSQKNSEQLAEKEREKENLQNDINDLKTQKERTDIALEYINDELSYVFYSNRKLQLEASTDNSYRLKVNGRNVTPNKISVGERNVLALCYFFARLYSDKSNREKYKSECLIVVDDPVSSFDYGNRLGVMTLLRYQFNCILKGNPHSRILVMSHDLYSVFDLVKIKDDVCGRSLDKDKEPRGYLALEDHQLKPARMRSEYAILLKHVFAYAASQEQRDPDETQEMAIGNVMRRLLEGFASFCYNKKFEEMLRMDDLLLSISPEKKRAYYGNFMFRLALNGESHSEEGVYALNGFNRYFLRDEKVKTAKTLLLFLQYINPLHIASYLSAAERKTLASWRTDETHWVEEYAAQQGM